MVNRENCLGCPRRPEESTACAWIAQKFLGKDYRPADCVVGPQVKVEHTDEPVSPIIGPIGLGYGRVEMGCGKDGEVTEVEHRNYANGKLYEVRIGSRVVLYDNDNAPKMPAVSPTQEDIDLEMACWDTY